MAGAPAVLYAWPANSVLASLKPGQRVPATVVGTATTDSSGHYAIAAAQAGLESAAASDGTVNLEVVALAPGAFATYSFSRTLGQMASGSVSLQAASAAAAANVSAAAVTGFAKTTTSAAAAAGAVPKYAPSCYWLNLKSLGPSWTVVGATFDTTNYVTQHFTYSYGEQSLLGVATSGSEYNGFTQTGSSTVSATASEDFGSSTGAIDTRYQTQFINSEFGYWCTFPGKYVSYQTRPTSYAGGALRASTGYPVAKYCVWQQANTTFTKNSSSAYTFGAGFYIPVINFNLTAQTGYNSGASISYHFGVAHYLCGTADYPGGTPRELVAGKV